MLFQRVFLYQNMIQLKQTASAALWQMRRNQLIVDSKIGFLGNVTLQFALDGDINKMVGTME